MEEQTTEEFAFNPLIGKRQPLAWKAMVHYLKDEKWYWVRPLVDHMAEQSSLQRKSVVNMLRIAHDEGIIERRNMFPKKKFLWSRNQVRMASPLHPWVRPVWENSGTNT
jgi:hypothetical protein